MEENDMKKIAYVIAALSAIAIAAPSSASAETVVIKRHGHHDWHQDRHRHDRTVVIQNHRHEGYGRHRNGPASVSTRGPFSFSGFTQVQASPMPVQNSD